MPSNENEDDQNIAEAGQGDLDEEESEEYEDEDLTKDDDDDEEEEEEDEDEDEEDLNSPPSTVSSSGDTTTKDALQNSATAAAAATTTSAVDGTTNGTVPEPPPSEIATSLPDLTITQPVSATAEEKKPSTTIEDSRRLFQRLWTDEDEIGLLQGFLEYTTQRRTHNSSHHHDTAPFYDQIKSRLQLDFNKNQLVEKLRRLKKKYRNVVNRISSGKDFAFKSPHDQVTFEISRKIWSSVACGAGTGGVEEAGLDDEETNLPNHKNNSNRNPNEVNNSGVDNDADANDSEKKGSRPRKRRKRGAEENVLNCRANSAMPNIVEETVRSCLSPLFKELLYCAVNGHSNGGGFGGLGGVALNPLPLNFGGVAMSFSKGEVVDEKWRKQQVLELEVYLKRIELVQDQIKAAIEELKAMES
ncbi:PREDICTED: probable transcription factor At3g04930 [Nelumbo nucifera]|uniref:Probable transcription factor At3g04930 n=1 Tax=Nelumbo nucifera TaxID=4432 RepID=A0A1U8B4L7_NELNU|nr:PREDICTED: probable transcription factor At3g04930 [Nelumbo nucifera]XP_010271047.1 PREDICTED: probable transcription factor At3g04930 [Nelumbo nucifera]